ncbi:hypothetical protein D3C83_106760 [compost metagenome]
MPMTMMPSAMKISEPTSVPPPSASISVENLMARFDCTATPMMMPMAAIGIATAAACLAHSSVISRNRRGVIGRLPGR